MFLFLFIVLAMSVSFKVWRVKQFAKLMNISFWKAYLLLGK